MSDEVVDRFRRVVIVLTALLVVGLSFLGGNAVRRDAKAAHMIYKSNRTGQILKVFGPDGKEMKMTPEEARKLRGAEVVLVP